MKTLGICIGATTITFVGLNKNQEKVSEIFQQSIPHEGNSRKVLLEELPEINVDKYDRIAVTGRKFRNTVNLTSITEPEAIEYSIQEQR